MTPSITKYRCSINHTHHRRACVDPGQSAGSVLRHAGPIWPNACRFSCGARLSAITPFTCVRPRQHPSVLWLPLESPSSSSSAAFFQFCGAEWWMNANPASVNATSWARGIFCAGLGDHSSAPRQDPDWPHHADELVHAGLQPEEAEGEAEVGVLIPTDHCTHGPRCCSQCHSQVVYRQRRQTTHTATSSEAILG